MVAEMCHGAVLVQNYHLSHIYFDQTVVNCLLEELAMENILVPIHGTLVLGHLVGIHVKRIEHKNFL